MSTDNCQPNPESISGRFNERVQRKAQVEANAAAAATETRNNAAEIKRFVQRKREFKKQKDSCKKKSSGGRKKPKLKFCICPCCNPLNKIFDKIAGRNFFTIPFTTFKIPRFDHLIEKIPTFDQNRREGEKCGACNGTRKITDPTDDSAKYSKVADKVKENAGKIMEREAKLGLGGARTTIIQGNDTLLVGLGFNDNQTYEVAPDTSIAPAMRGNKVPQQGGIKVNTVVGKQGGIAWPQQVGSYTIKCANKFNMIAGAGGITLATHGPLTFSAGITKFVGPQISIGCSSGPLTLEGDSVNITGKAVTLTPTSGTLFVKGSIANTGNITTQGHAHFESVSFPKAACVGVTKSTYTGKANPDVLQTQPALWGASAVKGAVTDLKAFYQSVPMDSKTAAFRVQSPQETKNIGSRVSNIAGLSLPWEPNPTGYVLPGTKISLDGTCPCNEGGKASGIITGNTTHLVPIHNIPHAHGIPEMMHKHEIQLPDIDYTSDSPQTLRDKTITSAQESGVPADPTRDTQTRKSEVLRTGVEFIAAKQVEATKMIHQGVSRLSQLRNLV